MSASAPRVGVVMGSDSDLDVMSPAAAMLTRFDIAHELRVVSAHRRPHEMLSYGGEAVARGLEVIIAGAGGAAHLPGMLASTTVLPVIGVPVPLRHLDGIDSLLSIVQMPLGVPVATVSLGGGHNAGLLAVRILGTTDPPLREALAAYRDEIAASSRQADARVRQERPAASLPHGTRPC